MYTNCLVFFDFRYPIPSKSCEGTKVASFSSWGRSHLLLVCFSNLKDDLSVILPLFVEDLSVNLHVNMF
jgi:hypothetical protein